MKTSLYVIFCLFFTSLVFSQSNSNEKSMFVSRYNNTIYTLKFDASKLIIENYLKINRVDTREKSETYREYNIDFILNEKQFYAIDSLINLLGYSSKQDFDKKSNVFQIQQLTSEIAFIKKQLLDYQNLLNKFDEKSEKYLECWNTTKELEKQLFDKETLYAKLKNVEQSFYVHLVIYDESINEENSRVSFVNMPGVEYSYLKISDPTSGISNSTYQGYFLKYMFTKGKSYACLGAYNTIGKKDSAQLTFSEMFMFSFGQDFYSRHLGRGSRKSLNLYTGYQVGLLMATNTIKTINIPFVSPSIGVELYKNKFLLIDTKVNYLLPLQYNKEMRGLSGNLSFNFVF